MSRKLKAAITALLAVASAWALAASLIISNPHNGGSLAATSLFFGVLAATVTTIVALWVGDEEDGI